MVRSSNPLSNHALNLSTFFKDLTCNEHYCSTLVQFTWRGIAVRMTSKLAVHTHTHTHTHTHLHSRAHSLVSLILDCDSHVTHIRHSKQLTHQLYTGLQMTSEVTLPSLEVSFFGRVLFQMFLCIDFLSIAVQRMSISPVAR